MNIYCINGLMFTKNKNNNVKLEIDRKIDLHSCCINCVFKTFENIDEEELSYLLESLISL